ncbi:unnamed protein product [Rhizophagus irregularis]|nr:unnamed protein product [Rhizophagus irregularis]
MSLFILHQKTLYYIIFFLKYFFPHTLLFFIVFFFCAFVQKEKRIQVISETKKNSHCLFDYSFKLNMHAYC